MTGRGFSPLMGNALRDAWLQIGEKIGILAGAEDGSEILKLAAAEGEFEVEVARPGKFTAMGGKKVTLSPDLLTELAATFDPTSFRPPNKLGHPDPDKTDTPAYGPVNGLRYDSKKERLLAKVDPTKELRQMIQEKKFTERSIEYTPDYRGTGKARLLGIGWLGATPPAIDGLAALAEGLDKDGTVRVMATGEPEKETVEMTADENVIYYFREFTAEQRKKAAKEGAAMPDGSFPIQNGSDLENAIRAIGRAKDPAAAKAHIRKRAKALGLTDKLPESWDPEDQADKGKDETKEKKGAAMSEETAVQLAETKKKLERLEQQVKDGAAARAKIFMAANVKKIPMKLVQAGLENQLAALFAMDAQEERVIKFAGADGKETQLSVSKLVTGLVEALPDQLSTTDGKEIAKGGADDVPDNVREADFSKGVKFAESAMHTKVALRLAEMRKTNPKTTYTEAYEALATGQ